MGNITVLNQAGDEQLISWDPKKPEEVAKAKRRWKDLKKQGYEFFEAGVGSTVERVSRFRRDLGRVIASPGVKKPADKKIGTRSRAMGGGPNARRVL